MKRILSFLAVSAILFTSCGKKKNVYVPPAPTYAASANSFSIEGGSFANSSVDIRKISQQSGSYDGTAETTLQVTGTDDELDSFTNIAMIINFTGNGVLTQGVLSSSAAGGSNNIQLTFQNAAGKSFTYNSNDGTINVTAYPAIGSQIVGNFNGTFTPGNGTTGGNVTISKGLFSVTRVQ